ncbi:hypothetical protein [Streptomyces sp. R44]|uniref:Uncharacterized protein n=1 Tax=Streptomyces sp. R44 TaxID=3238633 RepID=A0AB39T1V4_9ACTN
MAEVTTGDLQIQIAGLSHKLRIVDGGWLPSTNWLKEHLIVPEFKDKFLEIHKEIVKNPVSEYWEAAGFDGIAAGIEKLYEGEGLGTAFKYWMSTGAGAFAAIVVGGIGVYLTGKLTSIQRTLQQWGDPNRLIRAYDADGNITRQSRTDVEARERRVANGGTSLADLPPTANFDGLRAQLELLIPQMEKFNDKAPAFLRDFAKLPKESAARKAAEGVKKVADAIKDVDHQRMPLVSSGMGKITGAVRNSDPKKTKKFADAIGKLKLAMDGLDVNSVPKAGTLGPAATAARDLAQHTGTLSGRMRDFAQAVRDLNAEMGGGAAPSH